MPTTEPTGEILFRAENLWVEGDEFGLLLVLDVAGRSVNVLGRQVLTDLEAALNHIAGLPSVPLLGLVSNKEHGFCAGADIHEFAAVRGADDAVARSALGQRLFDRLANLAVPTVALINGPCLGGGLELALACDYRIAIDHPRTQLGLPEIQLGLIPAWAGTQRLPRTIGLEQALQVILGSRQLDARQALRWGLADAVAPRGEEQRIALRRLAHLALKHGKRQRERLPLRTWRQRVLESTSIGRALIFRGAERILRRRVPDDMPAPREALEAVRTGLRQGLAAGLEYERQAVGRLATSPACRNLVSLFLQREEARRQPTDKDASPAIRRVGIVGAGTMGAGIAQLAALRGCEVIVQEVNADALGAGLFKVAALFEKAVERGLLSREESRQRLAAIRGTTKLEGFERVDLVVEAVVEEIESKRRVFRELEQRTRPEAILATNTSSLRVAHLQEGLSHPERVGGLHFFNPVHKMPLVEVVRGPATSAQTLDALVRWAATLGKTPVRVGDGPGFVVNRILMPYLNEAVLLLGEGLGIDAIDGVMRRFGMPLGPLELLDQVGLDVADHIARSIQPAFGDRFAPNPLFALMTQQGWLGQKSGVGFYLHRGRKRQVNSAATTLARKGGVPSSFTRSLPMPARLHEARERMVLLMVNEAAACLAEGLAADAGEVDLAMVLGTGWAPHRGGPLRYGEDRGFEEVTRVLGELAQRLGTRFIPCPEILKRAEKRFEPRP